MASFSSAAEVVESWVAALNSGQYSAAAGLYDASAVLIPTFAPRPLASSSEIGGYFENLQRYDKVHVELEEESMKIQKLSESLHCTSGLYSWDLEKEGEMALVPARYSFLIDLSASAPIRHHHSSEVPKSA